MVVSTRPVNDLHVFSEVTTHNHTIVPAARPAVQFSTRTRCWTLVSPFDITLEGRHMCIPSGFQFDLASVPRFLWWFMAPFELSIAAPLTHDWLYCHGGCVTDTSGAAFCVSRRAADRVFRCVMQDRQVKPWRIVLAWCAVRAFGWAAWQRRVDPRHTRIVHAP